MRFFGRRRTEERADVGNAVGEVFLAQAQRGTAGDPAAVDAAAAIWSGSLAGCTVEGDHAAAVTPSVLAAVGDAIVRRGAYLARIEVTDGVPRFREAWSWTWQGTDRMPTVRVTESGIAQVTTSRTVAADGVVWFRWRDDPQQPWTAVPPIVGAARKWASEGERALGDELSGDVTIILPMPRAEDPDSDKARQRNGDTATRMRQSRGRTLLVPSASAHWQDDKAPAPSEWQPRRLGPHPPESEVAAAEAGHRVCLEQAGIPRGMIDGGSAQAAREALRRFALVSLGPMARRIAEEFAAKLGGDLEIKPDPALFDLQGRAGAFRALTSSEEIHTDVALDKVGLE